MNIVIKAIPTEEIKLRKGFGGADWWYEDDVLQIRVASELSKEEQMALIAHELVEAFICDHMGIKVEDVDAFDLNHIADEKDASFNSGDQSGAPYKIPHTYATAVERILTGVFGVDWLTYDQNLSKL